MGTADKTETTTNPTTQQFSASNMTTCMIVLPARLESSRLPKKLLKVASGKTILQHTFEAASQSTLADQILVAVDDHELAKETERFGGSWKLTSTKCQSGTDRVAEVATQFPEVDIFVNVQSDEPEISGDTIDLVISSLQNCPKADISTAGTPIRDAETLRDPSCVKVVMGDFQRARLADNKTDAAVLEAQKANAAGQGRALYFSRSAVPHLRDGVDREDFFRDPPIFWHHIGIYAYRREFLEWFTNTPPSRLEQIEKLEQLRALEAGKIIQVAQVPHAASGIDTQNDFDQFVARLADNGDK